MFGSKYIHKFHPESMDIKYTDNKEIKLRQIDSICHFLSDIDNIYPRTRFIIKPVYGSQGKGIKLLDKQNYHEKISEIQKSSSDYIISRYIENPMLLRVYNNRKFGIRHYVLLTLENNKIDSYLLKIAPVYFAINNYDTRYDDFITNETDFFKSRHITNLQLITDFNKKYDLNLKKYHHLTILDNIFSKQDKFYITSQIKTIINYTIESISHNLRTINRFKNSEKNYGFNLIAYDTLLDDRNNLWLMEINRGPDMNALNFLLGLENMIDIFSELFDIVVDHSLNLNFFTKLETYQI
jgi:hypothetical protein